MEEKNNFTTKYTIDGGSAWFYRGGAPDVFLPLRTIGVWS